MVISNNNIIEKEFDQMLMDLIKERRSVCLFNGKKISTNEILSIIEGATWAPTGCNNQELRFLILEKEEEINEILKFKPIFRGVSHIVLIFCDMSLPMSQKMYIKYKFERHLPYIDTGLALGNMILYAKSKGIDSCIFNLSEYHIKQEKNIKLINKILNKIKAKLGLHTLREDNFEFYLRKHLKIPKHLKIKCGVAFGFAKKYPNVNTDKHGWNKIMRKKVSYYILSK